MKSLSKSDQGSKGNKKTYIIFSTVLIQIHIHDDACPEQKGPLILLIVSDTQETAFESQK